jgi:uncharacterized protein YxjI
MQYPLKLNFKLFALAPQIYVKDSTGKSILFIRQKLFKLRERVEVFRDSTRSQKLFDIAADRIIDFSANYHFTMADGTPWGGVRRKGMRSIWAAHYQVIEDNRVDMEIREESPMKRVAEALLGEIPVVGFIALYLLNPSYLISTADGQPMFRAIKKPSVFERYFEIHKLGEMDEDDELRALLALMMMVMLEKNRG